MDCENDFAIVRRHKLVKRKYMRTRQLKPGMKLDHPVVDRLGRNLVARGAELDEYMIDSMVQMGVMSVYIQDGEEEEEVKAPPASAAAEKNIEKLHEKGFTFSVAQYLSIHHRLLEGIYKHAGKIRDYNITKK